jgi:hypothetical protein
VNDNKQEGVTVLDALALRKSLLDPFTFTVPYQFFAGDVNNSGNGSTFDIALMTKMAIGDGASAGGSFWKFISADYVFPSPVPPFGNPPSIIDFNNLAESIDSVDFMAIKPGDVMPESWVDSSTISPQFYLEAHPPANGQVVVDVRASGFQIVQGFQFGLAWDASILGFSHLAPGTPNNTNVNPAVPGQLQLISFTEGQTAILPSDSVLFSLVFDALTSASTSTPLSLDPSLLPFQVVVEDCKLAGAALSGTTVSKVSAASGRQPGASFVKIVPNPVGTGQPVRLEVQGLGAQSLHVQIVGMNGKLLHQWERQVPAGSSTLHIEPGLGRGIYFLKITDAQGRFHTAKLAVF